MILRCTGKLLTLLGQRPAVVEAGEDDWYANLLWLGGHKCVLLTHAATLFPVFAADVRVAELRPVGAWLTATITHALDAEGLPRDILGGLTNESVVLAKTASRGVLGVMNEMAFQAQHAVAESGALTASGVEDLNRWLRRCLYGRAGRYATPLDLVATRRG
jgi:hypothetical protein